MEEGILELLLRKKSRGPRCEEGEEGALGARPWVV